VLATHWKDARAGKDDRKTHPTELQRKEAKKNALARSTLAIHDDGVFLGIRGLENLAAFIDKFRKNRTMEGEMVKPLPPNFSPREAPKGLAPSC